MWCGLSFISTTCQFSTSQYAAYHPAKKSDDDHKSSLFFLHTAVLRDPVTVSQLATTPLNINKPWFVYFVHWKGENIFPFFYFVDCSNVISAYQQQNCGGGGGDGDRDWPERERERKTASTNTKFNALFVCINCTGANQTGDSSDFIFPLLCPCLSSSSLG